MPITVAFAMLVVVAKLYLILNFILVSESVGKWKLGTSWHVPQDPDWSENVLA